MKAIAVLSAAVAALALAATASGKELRQLTACGASGCRTTTDQALMRAGVEAGPPTSPPGTVSSYYTLEFVVDEGNSTDRWVSRFYPDRGVGRAEDRGEVIWFTLTTSQRAAFRELTRGLRPFAPDGGAPASASASDDGFPWVVFVFSLALATLIGATAVFNLRRRAPQPAAGS